MKTFSSILILCLAFTFGNAQEVTVHAESDPAVDFNNYKTFTIVDRDLANANMNQDQKRAEGEVSGSGYGSQGATGATEQGTTNQNQTYGTTNNQNDTNTTNSQNNTSTQGTYGTTNDQNRNDETMADTDETDVETDVDVEVEGDDVAGNPEPYEFSDREDRDQGVVTGPENMSSDSNRDEGGSVGTTNTNPSNENSTYNNNEAQNNTQTGTVNSNNSQNNMGNNQSQNQTGTTNNQDAHSSSSDHQNMSNDPTKKALKEAIKTEMESRGFTYTENEADLIVNYSIFDGEATVSMTGDNGTAGYAAWGPNIGEDNMVEIEDGSVIIHLVDAERNQLVFTAYATSGSDEGSLKEDQVQEAVSKVFEEIPEMDKE